jgi:hypothetical protein
VLYPAQIPSGPTHTNFELILGHSALVGQVLCLIAGGAKYVGHDS